MTPRIMKYLSVVLLLGGLLGHASDGFRIVLGLVVCCAALVVFYQAVHLRKYFWATGFLVMAVLLNPAAPLAFSNRVFFWLDLTCLLAFAVSLVGLRASPRLSIPGIIAPHRRIESL